MISFIRMDFVVLNLNMIKKKTKTADWLQFNCCTLCAYKLMPCHLFMLQISQRFVHKLTQNTVSIEDKHRAKIPQEAGTRSLEFPLHKI